MEVIEQPHIALIRRPKLIVLVASLILVWVGVLYYLLVYCIDREDELHGHEATNTVLPPSIPSPR